MKLPPKPSQGLRSEAQLGLGNANSVVIKQLEPQKVSASDCFGLELGLLWIVVIGLVLLWTRV